MIYLIINATAPLKILRELNISGKVMQRIGVGRHQYYFQSVVD